MIVRSLLLLSLLHIVTASYNGDLRREKRTLIWPPGVSKIQLIVGFGIPVDLKRETVIFGTVMKANYKLPTNVSQITTPYIFYERRKRSTSRWDIYRLLAQATEMRGLGGKSCILKAICDVAQTPFDNNYGLFHELLHLIFTPSTTKEKINLHADNEYYAAQTFGKNKENCEALFPDCKTSLMDILSLYNNELY